MLSPLKRRTALKGLTLAVGLAGAMLVSAPPSSASPIGGDCYSGAYAPPGGGWGPTFTSQCAAIFGSTGYQLPISFTVVNSTDTPVCLQGYSYEDHSWHLIGCGTSGEGTIPWGAVIAYPEVQAASAGLSGTELWWWY
jgi:hypothetical protein